MTNQRLLSPLVNSSLLSHSESVLNCRPHTPIKESGSRYVLRDYLCLSPVPGGLIQNLVNGWETGSLKTWQWSCWHTFMALIICCDQYLITFSPHKYLIRISNIAYFLKHYLYDEIVYFSWSGVLTSLALFTNVHRMGASRNLNWYLG